MARVPLCCLAPALSWLVGAVSVVGLVDFPSSVCETRGHLDSWFAVGSACGLLSGGLYTGQPWMLMPMLDLFLPPTSYLFLLALPYPVVCGAWSAVAAFGTGFAVGTAAIAVLCNPCLLC